MPSTGAETRKQQKRAVQELDKTLEMAPKDEIAKKLRDVLTAKPKPAAPAAPKEPDLNLPPPPPENN